MKNIVKKLISFHLAISLVFCGVCIGMSDIRARALPGDAGVSGNCGDNGDNLMWRYTYDTKTLDIIGTGDMRDYTGVGTGKVPWKDFDGIEQLNISSGVTSIGNSAFSSLGITSVVIPNTVTRIGNNAFSGCIALNGIVLPDSVTSIGAEAFADTGIYNNASNWENGVLYIGNHLIEINSEFIPSEYRVKDGTLTIADYAFYRNSVTRIIIPSSVTSIGANAMLYGTTSEITFENNSKLTNIGEGAFSDLYYLKEIILPESVLCIGDKAFYNCIRLENIHIPSSVQTIGENILENTTAYICSETADCYAKKYADENGIEFRVCGEIPGTVPTFRENCPFCGEEFVNADEYNSHIAYENAKKEVKIEIRKPSTTTVSYGDSMILHADVENMPVNAEIVWEADNDNFSFTPSEDGKTCKISPKSKGDTTFTAKIVDKDENTICSDEQIMTSKAGFFDKIIAFFKGIFGLSKTYSESVTNI